jgi:hypothetical protein
MLQDLVVISQKLFKKEKKKEKRKRVLKNGQVSDIFKTMGTSMSS